jgi:O-Antigen ligase
MPAKLAEPGQPAKANISSYLMNCAVWTMLAVSFFVYVEPAPVDLIFVVVLLFFTRIKLSATLGVAPLFVLLLIYNLGGFLSFLQAPAQPKAMMFIMTSSYMAITGVVFALYIAVDPLKHTRIIGIGWIFGAVMASIWGIVDYFNLPSPMALQVLPGRATGFFKDPNVFSTYLIFPVVLMIQSLVLKQSRHAILLSIALFICVIGLFLSFSRGAWASITAATALMLFLTFVLCGDQRLRTRLVLFSIGGLILASLMFMVLMSIPEIQNMFVERFALVQYYDAGETGRFGNQLRSLPDLAARPFGYGPLVFHTIYGQDPHNTFLNAFASYGWFGGITYALLVISTFIVGIKTVFTKTPWQPLAIAIFCPLISTILQGVQIDTEHWRHFYWMLGMMWGLYAATAQYAPSKQQQFFAFQPMNRSAKLRAIT